MLGSATFGQRDDLSGTVGLLAHDVFSSRTGSKTKLATLSANGTGRNEMDFARHSTLEAPEKDIRIGCSAEIRMPRCSDNSNREHGEANTKCNVWNRIDLYASETDKSDKDALVYIE